MTAMDDERTLARLALVAHRIEDAMSHTGCPLFDEALMFAYGDTDGSERELAFVADLRSVLTAAATPVLEERR